MLREIAPAAASRCFLPLRVGAGWVFEQRGRRGPKCTRKLVVHSDELLAPLPLEARRVEGQFHLLEPVGALRAPC